VLAESHTLTACIGFYKFEEAGVFMQGWDEPTQSEVDPAQSAYEPAQAEYESMQAASEVMQQAQEPVQAVYELQEGADEPFQEAYDPMQSIAQSEQATYEPVLEAPVDGQAFLAKLQRKGTTDDLLFDKLLTWVCVQSACYLHLLCDDWPTLCLSVCPKRPSNSASCCSISDAYVQ